MQMSCNNISMIDTAFVIANSGSVFRFVPGTIDKQELILKAPWESLHCTFYLLFL